MRSMLFLLVLLMTPPATAAEEFPADWFWGSEKQRARHDAMVGRPAPELRLVDAEGRPAEPKDTRGKVVVVDFWATWCGPCRKALPENVELMKEHADDGLVILGIHDSQRGAERMGELSRQYGLNYPLYVDVDAKSQKAWNVLFWPTIAVLDRNGTVRAVGLRPERLRAVVEKLLAEPAPPTDEATATAEAAPIDAEFGEGKPDRRERVRSLLDAPPPALRVDGWLNSEPLDLESLRGKVVLLDFWATWCGPCLASVPKLNALAEAHADDLVIIGVCHDRGHERMAKVVADRGIRYPVCHDVGNVNKTNYMVDGYPDYYLIDREGRLRVADCANRRIEDAVKRLVAEP